MSKEVEQIKDRLDIVSVISQYLPLQKAGANFKANCPFHHEKTPSFFVSPQRNSYYCFGCGAKGDIFTFVEEIEGLDFRGALEMLAQKAGVELQKTSPKVREENDRTLSAIQEAAIYFKGNLDKSSSEYKYLLDRGLNEETVEKFLLGFAPAGWRNLKEKLASKGFTEEELLRAGLVKKSDESNGAKESYDVFRERIIFPLSESSGRIVGFSGRAIDEEQNPPKYLNSPDSAFFNKSELLYGLDKAKHDIRNKNFSILVEGQMDLLMSHQNGITNTVAASGTAITGKHLDRLKKISERLLIALDTDGAGIKAALRTGVMALEKGMEVKIAKIKFAKDPAEALQKSVEKYKDSLRQALPLIEFVVDKIYEETADDRTRAKRIEKEIIPLIALLQSSIERAQTIKVISNKTKIPEKALDEDVVRFSRSLGKTATYKTAESVQIERKSSSLNQIERHAAGLIFAEENGTKFPVNINEAFSFLNSVEREAILERYKPEREELVFEVENYYSGEDPNKARISLKEAILNYKDDCLKKRLIAFTNALSDAESKQDREKAKEILRLIQETTEIRNEILKDKI